jgi:mRNA interferase HigB
MRVVGRDKLDEFCAEHANARDWITNWLADTEAAQWRTPLDIKRSYAAASFLADNLVIFNVKGNHYRLEIQLAYKTGVVVIRWVGTHAEYTKRIGQKP